MLEPLKYFRHRNICSTLCLDHAGWKKYCSAVELIAILFTVEMSPNLVVTLTDVTLLWGLLPLTLCILQTRVDWRLHDRPLLRWRERWESPLSNPTCWTSIWWIRCVEFRAHTLEHDGSSCQHLKRKKKSSNRCYFLWEISAGSDLVTDGSVTGSVTAAATSHSSWVRMLCLIITPCLPSSFCFCQENKGKKNKKNKGRLFWPS